MVLQASDKFRYFNYENENGELVEIFINMDGTGITILEIQTEAESAKLETRASFCFSKVRQIDERLLDFTDWFDEVEIIWVEYNKISKCIEIVLYIPRNPSALRV